MKVCPECGHENPESTDYCLKCGRNIGANLVKANSMHPIVRLSAYKLDKTTGDLRISKTKAVSWLTFSFIFLFNVILGLVIPGNVLWAALLVGVLVGAIFALIIYLIGYGIAGILERLGFQ